MINLIEAAALDAVERLLPRAIKASARCLQVRHIAATPVGMRINAEGGSHPRGRADDFFLE